MQPGPQGTGFRGFWGRGRASRVSGFSSGREGPGTPFRVEVLVYWKGLIGLEVFGSNFCWKDRVFYGSLYNTKPFGHFMM